MRTAGCLVVVHRRRVAHGRLLRLAVEPVAVRGLAAPGEPDAVAAAQGPGGSCMEELSMTDLTDLALALVGVALVAIAVCELLRRWIKRGRQVRGVWSPHVAEGTRRCDSPACLSRSAC